MGTNVEVTLNWLRMQARRFAKGEEGGGEIIATVVVIAIVIVLGVMFQEQIVGFFTQLWGQATGGAGAIGSGGTGGSGGSGGTV